LNTFIIDQDLHTADPHCFPRIFHPVTKKFDRSLPFQRRGVLKNKIDELLFFSVSHRNIFGGGSLNSPISTSSTTVTEI
jgi:hypothetical protein